MDYFVSHIGVIAGAGGFVAIAAVAWWYLTEKNAELKRQRAKARADAAKSVADAAKTAADDGPLSLDDK